MATQIRLELDGLKDAISILLGAWDKSSASGKRVLDGSIEYLFGLYWEFMRVYLRGELVCNAPSISIRCL